MVWRKQMFVFLERKKKQDCKFPIFAGLVEQQGAAPSLLALDASTDTHWSLQTNGIYTNRNRYMHKIKL